jgi:hypothetical protein
MLSLVKDSGITECLERSRQRAFLVLLALTSQQPFARDFSIEVGLDQVDKFVIGKVVGRQTNVDIRRSINSRLKRCLLRMNNLINILCS